MRLLEGKETEYQNWKAENTDGYSAAIFRYAENWADLMEKERRERHYRHRRPHFP